LYTARSLNKLFRVYILLVLLLGLNTVRQYGRRILCLGFMRPDDLDLIRFATHGQPFFVVSF